MSSPVKRRSLRRKLMVIVMAATTAALLLSAVAMLVYEASVYRSGVLQDLRSQAELLAQSLAPTLAFDDAKAAQEALGALKLRQQMRTAAVYRDNGELFAAYRAAGTAATPLPAAAPRAGMRFDSDEAEVVLRIEQGRELLGTLVLRAGHDFGSRIVAYLVILALTSAAGLAVAAQIYRRMHPAITRPILAMADASRRFIDERRFDVHVSESSDDEIGLLVEAFNRLLRDLAAELQERQHAEQALRLADQRKDEFLATLAHELRNPLAPLSNALAIQQRADDDPALQQRMRGMMERQLAQLVRLVDDLLEVSRITRGKIELRRQTTDVVAAARCALEAAEPALRGNEIVLETDFPAVPLWADADPARLAQVFVNLLNNAAKYTHRGGHVRFAVTEADGQAVVAVSDDGIGISPADQAEIFEMFVQLDRSLERGAAGLGVGLTIARQMLRLHGGTLAVASEGPGRGSTFTATLPLVAPPEAAAAPAAAAAPSGGPRRVLIADDNADFANSLASLLGMEGHHVTVVHDGRAALDAAAREPPEVAFLDIGMPGVNGYELARRLRADAATRQTLLVAVTGWGQEGDRQRVREAGYDHHWVKPIDVQRALALLAGVSERASERAS